MNSLGFLILFFFIFFSYKCDSEDFPRDANDVLLLNNSTFQDAVNKYQNLFVFLYLEDEPETNSSISLLDQVAKEITKLKIKATLSKLPLGYDNTLFAKYSIEGVSAFMAIMDHGERFVEYTDSLDNMDNIILFINRKLLRPVKEIDDPDLLKSVIEGSRCISVGFFENFTSAEYEEYKSNADWYYLCEHFASKNPEVFKYFKVQDKIPTIKMYKGCIHDSVDFPSQLPLAGIHILKFFIVSMEPDVDKYGMRWLTKRTFKDPQFTLMLFIKSNDPKKQFYIDILEKYSRRYREEISMAYVEVDGEEEVGFLFYTFDIKATDVPIMRAIELTNRYGNNTRKYKPRRKTINEDSIRRFIGEVYYRQLQPYLISEKLPSDWNKDPIVTVVGENFKNLTEDVSKTVLIVFYYDQNKYKTALNGPLLQLTKDFQKVGRNDILIGKSNYVNNEYFGWHPDKFPCVIIFPKGANKHGIIYNMELTYEDLREFIESDGRINMKEQTTESLKTKQVITSSKITEEGEVTVEAENEKSNFTSSRIEL